MNEITNIPMNYEQACEVKRFLRNEVVAIRTRADRLIHNTGMKQAGFNAHDLANQLESLGDLLDEEFPEEDE